METVVYYRDFIGKIFSDKNFNQFTLYRKDKKGDFFPIHLENSPFKKYSIEYFKNFVSTLNK